VTLSAFGSLVPSGVDTISSPEPMAGVGALTITPTHTVTPPVSMSAVGALTLTSAQVDVGTVAMAASGTLTLTPGLTVLSGVTFTAVGGLTVVGNSSSIPLRDLSLAAALAGDRYTSTLTTGRYIAAGLSDRYQGVLVL
jgi:hypothetical protein